MASTTMVIGSLASAAPPEPGPAIEPTIDPAPDEKLIEAESAPPESAPPESAPPEPELPGWDAELPSYETLPEAEPSEPSQLPAEAPQDGLGSTVVGAMLLGGGIVLTATSAVLLFEDSDEIGVWIAGTALGSIVMPVGMGLLISGAVKRKRYEPWATQHNPPRRGTGMLGGGTLAISAGTFGLLMGAISLPRQDADDLPYGEVLLSLASVSIATGVALVVVGGKRRKRFDAWDRARLTPSVALLSSLPTPTAGLKLRPAGATFGVTGRF